MEAGGRKQWVATFFKVVERLNLENQTISELYTDDNKSKYSRNSKDNFKFENKFFKKIYSKEATSKFFATNFFSKSVNRKKIFNEQFNLCEVKKFL